MPLSAFDEMTGIQESGLDPAAVREAYAALKTWLDNTPPEQFDTRRSQAELFFRRIGITFAVYGDNEIDRAADPVRHHPAGADQARMGLLERGLKQRVTALNMFLADIYGPQDCIKAGIIPGDLVYRTRITAGDADFEVPHGKYVHIAGIDIVRTAEDQFFVLEDNARTRRGSPTCWRTAR